MESFNISPPQLVRRQ